MALVLAGAAALQTAPLLAQDEPRVQELAIRWTEAYDGADVNGVGNLYASDARTDRSRWRAAAHFAQLDAAPDARSSGPRPKS